MCASIARSFYAPSHCKGLIEAEGHFGIRIHKTTRACMDYRPGQSVKAHTGLRTWSTNNAEPAS
ncbi:hypothetical protein ACFV2N_47365 [Streptomyces sp. NPDC059680]|uniref:hypothetical protein n=1 Tax=Streptomyces sp. NPDC059680 TaxID=3346904 RepID=UPI003683349A